MRVLGLIPARGGSKGVPRKNVRSLGGKPLIVYTIEAALAATKLTRVVVSTDDDEIAEVSRAAGAEVPFRRPDELAADATPTLPVVLHALDTLDEPYDAVCLLQPTTPFRVEGLIDTCIARFESSGADSVVTVGTVPTDHNPHWVYFMNPDGELQLSTGEDAPITRRQDLPDAYHRDGAVYVSRVSALRRGSLYGHRLVGVPSDDPGAVNIDTAADWAAAEARASKAIE